METTIEKHADFGKYRFGSKDDFSGIVKSEARILGVLYSRPGQDTTEKISEYEKRLDSYLRSNLRHDNLSSIVLAYNAEESDFFSRDITAEKVKADLRIEDGNCLRWYKDRRSFQEKLEARRSEISYLPDSRLKRTMSDSYLKEVEALDADIADADVDDAYDILAESNFRLANLCLYANNLYEKMLPEILLSRFDDETKAYFSEFIGTIACYSAFDIERSSIIKGVERKVSALRDKLGTDYREFIETGMTSEAMYLEDVYRFDSSEVRIRKPYDLANIRPEMAGLAKTIDRHSQALYDSGFESSAKASRSLINSKIFELTRHEPGRKIKNREVLA